MSATSRSTPTARTSSRPASKTGSSTTPQSGPIYTPSTARDAEAWWTSLRQAFPASPTQPQGSGAGLPTSATSGPIRSESLATWAPDGCCWRTYQASLLTDTLEPWSESWPVSGTTRSGTLYLLPPLVPRTSVGDGGVSLIPQVIDLPQTNANTKRWGGLNSLTSMAEQTMWPTPDAMWQTPSAGQHNKRRQVGQTERAELLLRGQAESEMWATPDERSHHSQGSTMNEEAHSVQLGLQASRWATPSVPNGGRTPKNMADLVANKGMTPDGKRQVELACQAKMWASPKATDGSKGGPNQRYSNGALMLPSQTAHWPTPRANEPYQGEEAMSAYLKAGHRQPKTRGGKERGGGTFDTTLTTAVLASHQPPTTPKDGPEPSPSTPRLNPLFVEWLMGLPKGWLSCEPLETGSFRRWLQRFSEA
jgi:hypothetical protein